MYRMFNREISDSFYTM